MMFGMSLMGIFWVLGLLAVLLALAAYVAYLSRSESSRGRSTAPPEDSAVELLRHRLAKGEIDDEEYLRRRSALEDR
jgi:putative membrane protein